MPGSKRKGFQTHDGSIGWDESSFTIGGIKALHC